MEEFYYRGRKSKESGLVVPVFAFGHHKPENEGPDPFTKQIINFYQYGNKNERTFFLQKFLNLLKERFEGDVKFDILCVVPRHEQDQLNPNIVSFAEELSQKAGIKYEQVIRRARTVKPGHELKTADERFSNVKDSIGVVRKVRNETILVLDNLCTTGANAQEVFDKLRAAGANSVFFMCFGLGSKAKLADFDINPAVKYKASEIVRIFHWPKVPKDKRKTSGSQHVPPDTL